MDIIENMIVNICESEIDEFIDETLLEPAEISILQNKLLEHKDEYFKIQKYLGYYLSNNDFDLFFLFGVFVNINYLPIIELLMYSLNLKFKEFDNIKKSKDRVKIDLSSITEYAIYLIKLNNKSGKNFLINSFNKLDDWNKKSTIESLFLINNKLALDTIIKLTGIDSIINKTYLDEINSYLKQINLLEKKYNSKVKFSIEFQLEFCNEENNIVVKNNQVESILNYTYSIEYEKNINKNKNIFINKTKESILNKLNTLINKINIDIIFRSLDDIPVGFSDERYILNFDLFTNKNITAKEIAELFGNKSILYLSGETDINGKKVFYENAAWYQSNENMPIQDKIFWNEPRIAKFRVYNVIDND